MVTTVQSYYAAAAALSKLQAAQSAAEEGEKFLKLTQDLEQGGEVAHADVIKSQLQVNDRRRQLLEAKLALLNARLDFAVLVFPDFRDQFSVDRMVKEVAVIYDSLISRPRDQFKT